MRAPVSRLRSIFFAYTSSARAELVCPIWLITNALEDATADITWVLEVLLRGNPSADDLLIATEACKDAVAAFERAIAELDT